MTEDITIRFAEGFGSAQAFAVTFGDEHVLDLEIDQRLRVCAITVLNAPLRLSASAALGNPGAYRLVRDENRDCLCVEFRKGASTRARSLIIDDVVINGERVLGLLWGKAEELEAIVVWDASRRLPWLAGSPPGTSYRHRDDVLVVKLFAGETVPEDLHGGTVDLPSGLRVALSLTSEGRLYMVIVLDAALWLSPAALSGQAADLTVGAVAGATDTVVLEIESGGLVRESSVDGVEVESFEIRAVYDGDRHLLGFIVPNASRALPPPFNSAASSS